MSDDLSMLEFWRDFPDEWTDTIENIQSWDRFAEMFDTGDYAEVGRLLYLHFETARAELAADIASPPEPESRDFPHNSELCSWEK